MSQDDEKSYRNRIEEFKKSAKSRLVVRQVVDSVQRNAVFSFDYVCYVLLASWIAAVGLAESSPVITVASMLVSPLMGPILAFTFGCAIGDSELRNLGFKSEVKGLCLCVLSGFVMGVLPALLEAYSEQWRFSEDWPSAGMTERGLLRNLAVGVLVAVPSVLGDNAGSLVGVAISASLLPPLVNAGMLWMCALVSAVQPPPLVTVLTNTTTGQQRPVVAERSWTGLQCLQVVDNTYQHVFSCDKAVDLAVLGSVSLLLAIINIVFIFAVGIMVLKFKEVAPGLMTDDDKEFFSHVKVVRASYTTAKGVKSTRLGKQFLKEMNLQKQEKEGLAQTDPNCRSSYGFSYAASRPSIPQPEDAEFGEHYKPDTRLPMAPFRRKSGKFRPHLHMPRFLVHKVTEESLQDGMESGENERLVSMRT